jgi:toxin ParE1/3/4
LVVKPAKLRAAAADDIERAVDHYLDEAGAEVAGRLVDALERALGNLARQPKLGSLRFSYDLGIPDLRSWPVQRFPYLIFYIEQDDQLDVWRVLHDRRDIPATLATSGE